MRPEYDFSGGVRGKHYMALRKGYTVVVHMPDGTKKVRHVKPQKPIELAPDVREYFPDSKAVNHALRTLITLVTRKPKSIAK
ncbi:MAG: hypothetical protein HY706_00610 [Candidatus Hydrogenedentes bacterium]|nr:hypothetical protein [Candidatus Hydrogenedentota bacterium]